MAIDTQQSFLCLGKTEEALLALKFLAVLTGSPVPCQQTGEPGHWPMRLF